MINKPKHSSIKLICYVSNASPPTQLLNIFKCVQNWKAHSFVCVCVCSPPYRPTKRMWWKARSRRCNQTGATLSKRGREAPVRVDIPTGREKFSWVSFFSVSRSNMYPPPPPLFFPATVSPVCVSLFLREMNWSIKALGITDEASRENG